MSIWFVKKLGFNPDRQGVGWCYTKGDSKGIYTMYTLPPL